MKDQSRIQIGVIQNITTNDLFSIVDPDTEDEDCKSIQTVLSHVVSGLDIAM
ncbi:MAG: hypothetical protein R2778_08355 [Saprospiraceae bacterium]